MKPKALASRLFDRNSGATGHAQSLWTKYERQVDCTDQQSTCHDGVQQQSAGRKEKCHKEVYFACLPEKYEPLIEDESLARDREEKKKKKEKYDKMKKNVGKAFRSSWKCLMLGLYSFALGYSAPATTAATVPAWSTLFHQGGARD